MLEIRQANESDIRDLADLDNECFDTYYYKKTKFSESDFKAYFCCKKSLLLLAVRNSCLVGYIAGTMPTSRFRSIAHLDSIAVSSTERNKGIGSRLLDIFIQEAKQRNCTIVLLEVADANKKDLIFSRDTVFKESTICRNIMEKVSMVYKCNCLSERIDSHFWFLLALTTNNLPSITLASRLQVRPYLRRAGMSYA